LLGNLKGLSKINLRQIHVPEMEVSGVSLQLAAAAVRICEVLQIICRARL
jgi:hypothetical protein